MPTRRDPTRTIMLRRRFAGQMRKRMNAIRKAIRQLVLEDDVFGLVPGQPFAFNQVKQAWRFQTNPQKIESFRRWLQSQVDQNLLTTTATGQPWTAEFVGSAHRQGMVRAFTDANKALVTKPAGFFEGSREQFLRSAFAQPEQVQKVQLLATRAFEELRGVSASMAQILNRELATGLANGLSPRVIAENMSRRITRLTKTRALAIARTEIIHAHAEGQLDSFERLGVSKVGVLAEWSTAGDDRVCPQCAALEGALLTIKQARGLIPRHVNCRCAWQPQAEVERRGRRARTAKKVSASIKAERPKATARTARRETTWAGKGL